MPWHFPAPATHQKIKITAFVGLQRLPRLPVGVPLGDIGIAHFQI